MMTLFSKSRLGYVGKGSGHYAPASDYTESQLVKTMIHDVKKAFVEFEPVVLNTHGGHFQRAGFADLYIQINGCAIWIEAKRPGGDTTALQKANLTRLYMTGAYVATCDTASQVLDTVRHALAIEEKRALCLPQYSLQEEA